MALVIAVSAFGALWLLLWVLGLFGQRWGDSFNHEERLLESWRRTIGRLLHPSHSRDIERERKGVFFVTLSLICLTAFLALLLVVLVLVGSHDGRVTGLAINVGFFSTIVLATRITPHLILVAAVFQVWINMLIFYVCAMEGRGISSPTFLYNAVQPTFAFFMFGARAGVGITIMVFLQGQSADQPVGSQSNC